MCGIAGVIAKQQLRAADVLQQMIPILQHRGPDDTGIHLDQGAAFANMRLAIVDRAHGAQPMYTTNQQIGIVYNGEVYNFRELRSRLERHGARFNTNSDTEVVLRAFEQWGTDAFAKLNGMFACCLWNKKEDAVYLVRDQLGIKPLYVYEDESFIAFASEMKALLAIPNLDLSLSPEGIADYLTYRYTQAPYTMFRRVRRLSPGTYLRITDTGSVAARFWEPVAQPDHSIRTIEDAVSEFETRFRSAVDSQLMGEVPIGVMLSGGLDSSTIAYAVHELGANLRTYNIGFPDVNEFAYSRSVAEHLWLEHQEIITTPEDLLRNLDSVILALDEPLADPACLPLYELCSSMKKDVTVVLSGEGGDELFAGYPQYMPIEVHRDVPPLERFRQFLIDSSYVPDIRPLLRAHEHGTIGGVPLAQLLTTPFRNRSYFLEQPPLQGMLNFDLRTWIPDNLMMKADKMLMAHALEGRFPFLDQHLLEFSLRLPERFKRVAGEDLGKVVLRRSMQKHLPQQILGRPKMGFTVPVNDLLQSMRNEVLDTFREAERSPLAEFVNLGLVRIDAERFYRDRAITPLRIWTLFVLARWMTFAVPNYQRGSIREACPGRAKTAIRSHVDRIKYSGADYGKSVRAG